MEYFGLSYCYLQLENCSIRLSQVLTLSSPGILVEVDAEDQGPWLSVCYVSYFVGSKYVGMRIWM